MPNGTTAAAAADPATRLKRALIAVHPWYRKQITTEHAWPLMRAVLGQFEDNATKARFLPTAQFEKKEHYTTRVCLSQFLGDCDQIAASFAGAVFKRQPIINWGSGSDELQKWADDVDGSGTTLLEMLEENADEAIPMSLIGFYVDVEAITTTQAAELAAVPPQDRSPDGSFPTDVIKRAGITQKPRVRVFPVETITDWHPDAQGRPEWIKLQHVVTRKLTAETERETLVQWILLDRTWAQVFEAKLKTETPSCLLTEADIDTPYQVGEPVQHGVGMVPFAIYYGGSKKANLLVARSILEGSKRADLAGFQEDSTGTMARYLHGNPLLELLTTRDVNEIIRDAGHAVKLNPERGESISYKGTPSEAFDSMAAAVESRHVAAYRQAGADPGGSVDQATPVQESGAAKMTRFRNTESRKLARIASGASSVHWELLEIAQRRLMPKAPPLDVRAFPGTVQYPKTFDLTDSGEKIAAYGKAGAWIKSETWHRGMLRDIAHGTLGEVSREDAAKIDQEIAAQELPTMLTPEEKAQKAAEAFAAGAGAPVNPKAPPAPPGAPGSKAPQAPPPPKEPQKGGT